jgi:DNA-binding NarL/FixJ family response regulator
MSVLIVDDDDFTRLTLTAVVKSLDYDVVADAGDAVGAIDAARAERPHAAIVDLDLGEGPTGIDVAHGLRAVRPDIGIVILSSYADPRLMGRRSRPMPEGSQFLSKQDVAEAGAIDQALRLAIAMGDSDTASASPVSLTDSQIEIMRLVAAGYSNAEIAKRLWLTEAAVNRAITRLVKHLQLEVTKELNARVLIAREYSTLIGKPVTHG